MRADLCYIKIKRKNNMFSQKSVLTVAFLPLCVLFSQPVLAESTFSSKYAPYIGYQHSFTHYTFDDKSVRKYSPRFFVGMNPIQEKNYKMGFELGYTVPVSHEEHRAHYSSIAKGEVRENALLKTKSNDIYFTFYQTLSGNSHWFLKPGLEYYQHTQRLSDNRGNFEQETTPSLYLTARAGIGYRFNNGLAFNLSSGSRFIDLYDNSKPKRFLFNMNAEYAF